MSSLKVQVSSLKVPLCTLTGNPLLTHLVMLVAPSAQRTATSTGPALLGVPLSLPLCRRVRASGNGFKWEPKARTRAAEWTARKRRQQTLTTDYLRLPKRALALDPSGRVFVGNTTLLVALAAGFGAVAVACSLVVIVLILRSRRSARATDPGPGLSTPLVGE